jgi:nicotinamidase-related amidase
MMNLGHMALQRILESARKLGVPVIVTDIAGREPFVVLPLEQFEAMMGVESKVAKPVVEPVQTRPAAVEPTVEIALNKEQFPQITRLEKVEMSSAVESEEIPLEERFYLEPMDEGEGAA